MLYQISSRISPLTNEANPLFGALVRVFGPGGMVGDTTVELLETAEVLAERATATTRKWFSAEDIREALVLDEANGLFAEVTREAELSPATLDTEAHAATIAILRLLRDSDPKKARLAFETSMARLRLVAKEEAREGDLDGFDRRIDQIIAKFHG